MTHTYLVELSATAAAEDFSFDTVATPSMAKEHLT
jgi:hypothetical protein